MPSQQEVIQALQGIGGGQDPIVPTPAITGKYDACKQGRWCP